MSNKIAATAAVLALLAAPAAAAPKPAAFQIAKCASSRGTIAVVEGDMQAWTKYKLGSPRDLLGAMVRQSGCFTVHDAASGRPADFLLSALAGNAASVERSVGSSVARTAAGVALSQVIPFGGLLMGAFGGKKKKPVFTGLRVLAPSTGQMLIASTGAPSKAVVSLPENKALGAYISTRDGQAISSAFAAAYNGIVAQAGALATVQPGDRQSVVASATTL